MASESPSPIKQSDLLGRLVLDRSTAAEVGRVDQLWFDPKTHQVVGLTTRSGVFGRQRRAALWSHIENIGDDSVLISLPTDSDPAQPDTAEATVGRELWTDAGNRAGQLVDYRLNPETGDIIEYLFVSNGWGGIVDGTYCLSPEAVVSMNQQRLIALESAIEAAEQFNEGLGQKVGQVSEFLKGDYAKTKRDLEAVMKGTQAIASQFQKTTEKLTGKAQDQNKALPEASDAAPAEAPSDAPRDVALEPTDAAAADSEASLDSAHEDPDSSK